MRALDVSTPKHPNTVTLLDNADFDLLCKDNWFAFQGNNNILYVRRNNNTGNKINNVLLLHRIIMNAPAHLFVDHINGDGLDNQRDNLRLCTKAQNNRHRDKGINNTSGYKGVGFKKERGRYYAQIVCDYKHTFLGYFDTAKEAAKAYNDAALELHGEFAYLNNLEEKQ